MTVGVLVAGSKVGTCTGIFDGDFKGDNESMFDGDVERTLSGRKEDGAMDMLFKASSSTVVSASVGIAVLKESRSEGDSDTIKGS